MAVPKKRTGHSAQGHRRSNWKATKPETTKCPNCGETVLTHTVCTACGTYKGKAVSLKDRVEEVAVEEKPAKKSTKKAKTEEVVEEVKAEETEKTEE
jgi:large subunit ribosomal protein L32